MAEAPEYINPIIQAMVHAHQVNQERARLQQQGQQFQAENQLRKQQLDQQLKQIEYEHEYHQAGLDIQKQHQELLGKQARANAILEANQNAAKFGQPAAQASLEQIAPGLGAQVQLTNPQEQLQREIASIQGQQGAMQPFDIAKEQRAQANKLDFLSAELKGKKELSSQEAQQKRQEIADTLAGQMGIAKLSRGTQLQIAQMEDATKRFGLNLEYGTTPEQMKTLVYGGASGMLDLKPENRKELGALGVMNQMGFRKVNPKEALALREGQAIVPIFEQMQDLIDNSLPTTRLGGAIQGTGLKLAELFNYNPKLKTELDNLKSKALLVGQNVEGMTGRPLAKQLDLDLNSLVGGNLSQEDAKAKLNNILQMFTTKQEDVVMGGMSDAQKEIVRNAWGLRPSDDLIRTKVKTPAGDIVRVPKSRLDEAKAQGGVEVQ